MGCAQGYVVCVCVCVYILVLYIHGSWIESQSNVLYVGSIQHLCPLSRLVRKLDRTSGPKSS